MASTIESSQSGKFVEFDEYIDYQLEKTRNSIKWTDILTTLAGIAALMLGYLFLFQIVDHWIVAGGLSVYTRFLFLSTLLIVSGAWIVWKVVLPWWKQIHALYAARMIEEHAPGLKSSLLNLIDLQTSGREASPHIRNALEKRSATALSHMNIEHAIDRRGLLRTSWILLGIVVLCCLYALLSPKPISFLRPLTWADIAPSTRTMILEVTPGTAEVPSRVPVDIRVVVGGEAPKEVAFFYTTQDRTFVDERLLLSQVEDKPSEFQLPFAGENGVGLTQSIEYYITAGDAVSETYRLEVVLAPSATVEQIEYQFPAYTELEPRTQLTPPIDAIEGTQVTLFANTGGVPVTSAVLELLSADDKSTSHEEIPVTITGGTQLKATWRLGFRDDGTYAREYRIRCQTEEGLSEIDPARHPIVIRPDIPPEVALLDPQGDLERPANAVIPLVFKARDPDFKVSYVTLRVEKDGEELRSYPLFDGSKKVVVDRFRWELESLRLKPGDVLSFYAEARDNKQPYGNRKTSSPLKLTIVAPVTPEEAKQQQQRDEQQQESELQEEQQQAAAENGEQTADGNEGATDENQKSSDENNPEDKTSDKEGEGEKTEEGSGTSEKENGSSQEKTDQGTSSNDGQGENEKGNDQGNDKGDENKPGQNEAGKGDQQNGPGNRPLEDDGTDDAEALEKIIENQKKQAAQNKTNPDKPSPEKGDQPEDQTQTGNDPKGDQPNTEQENKNDPGAASKENPQGTKSSQEKGGTGGEKAPADENDTQDSTESGKGNGTDTEKTDDPKGKNEPPQDSTKRGTPTDDPGKPKDEPAEKGTGNPDPKGKGTPDQKPDPNAPRSPEDIEREPGTKPSTVPSKDPKNTNPADSRNEQPKNPNGAKPEQKPTQQPNATDPPKGADPSNPGKGNPDQKSNKPDSGENGGSTETTEGTPDQEGTGSGKPSDKPGESKDNPGNDQKGQPGQKDENGTKSDQGKPGDEKSGSGGGKGDSGESQDPASGEAEEGKPGESTGGTPSPGSSGASGGATAPPSDGSVAPGTGEGTETGENPAGASNNTPEPGNLDDAKEATDLVLKKLEEDLQRGEVDEKLLKELGWTEAQMQAFADRLRQQIERDSKDLSLEDQLKQRQFEEMLKNMNFNPDLSNGNRKTLPNRATDSFGSRRMPVPLEHREAYEAFTREISKRKTR